MEIWYYILDINLRFPKVLTDATVFGGENKVIKENCFATVSWSLGQTTCFWFRQCLELIRQSLEPSCQHFKKEGDCVRICEQGGRSAQISCPVKWWNCNSKPLVLLVINHNMTDCSLYKKLCFRLRHSLSSCCTSAGAKGPRAPFNFKVLYKVRQINTALPIIVYS